MKFLAFMPSAFLQFCLAVHQFVVPTGDVLGLRLEQRRGRFENVDGLDAVALPDVVTTSCPLVVWPKIV